jgi:hypothetical protein
MLDMVFVMFSFSHVCLSLGPSGKPSGAVKGAVTVSLSGANMGLVTLALIYSLDVRKKIHWYNRIGKVTASGPEFALHRELSDAFIHLEEVT